MKMKTLFCYIVGLLLVCSCTQREGGHKVVLCIPVYGQSLALGEEAERMTNLVSLASYAGGRIVTERLDHDFGYFDTDGSSNAPSGCCTTRSAPTSCPSIRWLNGWPTKRATTR